ncbi:MAG: GlsB/YeaQ/YmgE family stress response membrane protein [Acidimicrobiales bacterium]
MAALVMFLVVGLVAGYLARAILPGPDQVSLLGTLVLGLMGSFLGGFAGFIAFGYDLSDGAIEASGVVGSVIGAVIALLIYRGAVSDHA